MKQYIYLSSNQNHWTEHDDFEAMIDALKKECIQDIKQKVKAFGASFQLDVEQFFFDHRFVEGVKEETDLDYFMRIFSICDDEEMTEGLILDLSGVSPKIAEQVLAYVSDLYGEEGWLEERAELLSFLAETRTFPDGDEEYIWEVGQAADDLRLDLIIEELHDDLRKAA